MNITLVGYGKMGKEIEKLLIERGHRVVGIATHKTHLSPDLIAQTDVAIDFSTPDVVLSNLKFLMQNGVPTVVGTTGWHASYEVVKKWVTDNDGVLVHASNFSIGVNLFFKLNEQLAQLMNRYAAYVPSITEIHHTEKLDAPSGTAISLATDLIKENDTFVDWFCPQSSKTIKKEKDLKIEALRKLGVVGVHRIEYKSKDDTIAIEHEAHNRKGFALGAIFAAEWIQNKKGIFTMKDVLQLS